LSREEIGKFSHRSQESIFRILESLRLEARPGCC
jgi:hypothetical protein